MKLFRHAAKYTAAAALICSILAVGCGDTFRPIADPIFQPGGDPQNPDQVAVVHQNGVASGIVTLVNVSGDTNMGNFATGVNPGLTNYDFAHAGVFVPNTDSATVTAANGNTNVVTVALLPGSRPVATVAGPGSQYVLNTGTNSECPSSGSVGVVGVALALINNICVGPSPSFGVVISGRLYVLDRVANTVTVINAGTNAIIAVLNVGTAPVWATPSMDFNFLYVVNQGSASVSVINMTNASVATTIPTGGSSPVFGYMDRVLNRLYVVNRDSNNVSVFDASVSSAPVAMRAPIPVGPAPTTIATAGDGSKAYVGNTGSNTLTEIRSSNFATTDIVVGDDPAATVTWVAASRDGSKLYAATVEPNNLKNGTTIIRTSDNIRVAHMLAPQQDPNCNPSTTSCTLYRPVQVSGGRQ